MMTTTRLGEEEEDGWMEFRFISLHIELGTKIPGGGVLM